MPGDLSTIEIQGQGEQGQAGGDAEARTVPLAELRAERQKRQAAEARAAELEAAKAEAAAKMGELDALREKVTAFTEAEARRTEALAARNAAALAALPEAIRDLAPEGATADALAAWIDKAARTDVRPAPAGGRTASADAAGVSESQLEWLRANHPSYANSSAEIQRKFLAKFGPGAKAP